MVKINSFEEIDQSKLEELYEERGHGVAFPDFFDKVKKVIENEGSKHEVHQCECGEVFVINKKDKKGLSKDREILCNKCSTNNLIDGKVQIDALKRLEIVSDYLNDLYTDDNQLLYIPTEKLEKIRQTSEGLMAAKNPDEILFSFKSTTEKLLRQLNKNDNLNQKEKEYRTYFAKHFKKAIKIDTSFLNKIYNKSHENSLVKSRNVSISKEITNDIEKQNNSLVSYNSERKNERLKTQSLLENYKTMIEHDRYLKLILNIFNIREGGKYSDTPFEEVEKRTDSLFFKLEYLKEEYESFDLDEILKETHNTHLRNAAAHNQYNIIPEDKKIELTYYEEIVTFEQLEDYVSNLEALHRSLDNLLVNEHLNQIKPKLINKGIYELETSYLTNNNFVDVNYSKPSVLKIYQYWNYVDIQEEGYLPLPFFNIHKDLSALVIKFENNEHSFYIPITEKIYFWLHNLISFGKLIVQRNSIFPSSLIFGCDSKYKTIKLNGYDFLIKENNSKLIRLNLNNLINISGKLEKIEPDKSPMLESNLTSVDLKWDEEELKREADDLSQTKKSMKKNLRDDDIFDDISLPADFLDKMEQPHKWDRVLSKKTQEKVIRKSFFKVLSDNMNDIDLLDLKKEGLVCVEKTNLSVNLNKNDIIWAKLVSFPAEKLSQIWFIKELKLYAPEE